DEHTVFPKGDIRSDKPTFQGDAFKDNIAKVAQLKKLAADKQEEVPQLVLAWYLQQEAIDTVIPGAKTSTQILDNLKAGDISLSEKEVEAIDRLFNRGKRIKRFYWCIYKISGAIIKKAGILGRLPAFLIHYSFTPINRIELSTTMSVAPTSAIIAIQRVSHPGMTRRSAITFNTKAKLMFCLIMDNARRLRLMVYGSLSSLSSIRAISAVSRAVSVPAPPIAIPTEDVARAGASLIPSPTIPICL